MTPVVPWLWRGAEAGEGESGGRRVTGGDQSPLADIAKSPVPEHFSRHGERDRPISSDGQRLRGARLVAERDRETSQGFADDGLAVRGRLGAVAVARKLCQDRRALQTRR